jgi:hypothetical protein
MDTVTSPVGVVPSEHAHLVTFGERFGRGLRESHDAR